MVIDKEIVELVVDKLLEDGTLLEKANGLRGAKCLPSISKEYVRSVLNILSRGKKNLHAYDFKNMSMGIYGGIVWRKIKLDHVGDCLNSHEHTYDHFTYVESGSVDINGSVYYSGQWAKVPRHVVHTVIALEKNCVVYCINSEHEVLKKCVDS